MEDIYYIIEDYKPNITQGTLNNYTNNLKKIMQKMDSTDLNLLENNNKVYNVLSNLSPLTQRNYMNAIIVYLQAVSGDDNSLNDYIKKRDIENDKYAEFISKNQKSEKQKDNMISMNEVLEVLEYWKSRDFQKYLLLRLYIKYPMRNDMRNLELISLQKYRQLSTKDKNYLIKQTNPLQYTFAINSYKTVKNYGEKLIPIDSEFNKDISKLIRMDDREYLFINNLYNEFNTAQFTVYFQSLFEHTGKKIATTMLRHIVSSYHGAESLKNQKVLASNMMHSVSMNQGYIKLD